jgi:membrane-associated phospholipid phosphatase
MNALRPVAVAALLALGGAASAAQDDGAPPAREASSGCYPSAEPGRLNCFDRPSTFGFLLDVPRDIGGLARDSVRLENLPWTAGVVAATAGLLFFDQDLSRGAHRLGRWAGISSDGQTAKLTSWFPLPYPTDVGSGMYYIGDGMVPVMLTVGMLGYGLVSQDTRVLRTTSHLAEGLVGVAIVAQTLKHISGRQSPSRSTEDGGRWRPLTNPLDYQKNVPAFDAFPSGHMATAMVTVTVLAEDYPEYRGWVYGVGYTLMAALGFQMMNNDVHWASDYPLALAVGYGLGKHAASRGRRVVDADGAAGRAPAITVEVLPLALERGGGLAVAGSF